MNSENKTPETDSNHLATVATTPKASRTSRLLLLWAVTALLAGGLISGIVPRVRAQGKLSANAKAIVHQTVSVTNVNRLAQNFELSLPGDVHAFEEAEIHARAAGYLLKWHTDIGTKVTAGQLLAEIDTPELDQELNQARAALAQTRANVALARSTAERWQELLKDKAVSQQEADEKNSGYTARAADVTAAEAAVSRLEKLTSFKEVRAPFAGTITRRSVDTGALIRPGGAGAASSLFQLAQTDTLRVRVNVPQAYLRDLVSGAPALVRVAEYPDRAFTGKILRTSGAFDPATRTLLTEIEVPNRDGALFPGIHVDVQLSLAQGNPPLVVPATSVMIRNDGPQIAVVDAASAIRLQKVQLGRDLGRTVEVVAGLADGARIVTNPTDTLVEGAQVTVAGVASPKPTAKQIARR